VSIQQLAGLSAAVILGVYGVAQLLASRRRSHAVSLDACAADALSLAGRLRAANCPEGVTACQALLNVILSHPDHGQPPEVRT
jgi:hypothetical protein